MISFKTQEDAVPSALILFSAILLMATLAFHLLVKPPTAAMLNTGHHVARQDNSDEIEKTKDRAEQAREAIASRFWHGGSIAVTSAVLGKMTNEAKSGGLQITSFRPDIQRNLGGFTELTYTVQVAGPYPRVKQLLATLDTGSDKVVLESAQIAVSPSTVTQVQATLNISAYLLTDPTLVPAGGKNV